MIIEKKRTSKVSPLLGEVLGRVSMGGIFTKSCPLERSPAEEIISEESSRCEDGLRRTRDRLERETLPSERALDGLCCWGSSDLMNTRAGPDVGFGGTSRTWAACMVKGKAAAWTALSAEQERKDERLGYWTANSFRVH